MVLPSARFSTDPSRVAGIGGRTGEAVTTLDIDDVKVKFDRAGWGPGDVAHPWDIDITACVKEGGSNEFRYANAPWENRTPNYGFLAQHWVEAQVISYRR